jgi:hypothetical protein
MRLGRSSLLVFLVAVALRGLFFALAPELRSPSYPDASYYSAVAASVMAGDGFTVPYVWGFADVGGGIPANPVLPVPAFAHWAPIGVLVQLPFVALLGVGGLGSQLPFWIASGLFAVAALHLARRAGLDDRGAFAVGLIVAGGSGAGALFGQIDNYALFGALVATWAIAMDRLRLAPSFGRALVAGALAALALLCRTDGILVVGAGGLLLLAACRAPVMRRALLGYGVAAVAIVAPFYLRQLLTFGTISPSAASGRILYIRTYDELFSASGPLTPDHLFSWGLPALFNSRLEAVGVVATQLGLVVAGAVAVPFALAGLRSALRRPALRPYLLWLGLHTAWSIIVAAPHLPTGNYLHSAAAALAPIAITALLGIERIAPRIAAISSFGTAPDPLRSVRRWTFGLVVASWLVAAVATAGLVEAWSPRAAAREQVAVTLRAVAQPGDRLMSADPGTWWWRSGLSGVATPYDELPLLLRAAAAYEVDWLVVDREEAVPALAPLLAGESLSGISGPCAVVRNGTRIESALYRLGAPCP